MSEEQIRILEAYKKTFEQLFSQAMAALQQFSTGTEAQASQETEAKLKEDIRMKVFGERWNKDGNVVTGKEDSED